MVKQKKLLKIEKKIKKNIKKMTFSLFLLFLIQITLSSKTEVKDLFPNYTHPIYSGYLKTDIEKNELFYIFTPSQSTPSSDPLILWLNGGPGCSSLTGLLDELGPVTSDYYSGNFSINPYSWNLNASILFIEQPAGVGFSKTETANFTWDDLKSSKGLKVAIDQFFNEEFKEYISNDFYIAGESYAGIYVPYIASAILNDTSSNINLKGILVGNGLTLQSVDVEKSMVEFTFWRGLIGIELFEKFKRICPFVPIPNKFNNDIINLNFNNYSNDNVTHECNLVRKDIKQTLNGLDIYGIYRPCKKKVMNDENERKRYFSSFKYTFINQLRKNLNLEPEYGIWPESCIDDPTKAIFLNDNETKEKLGVDKNITWSECAQIKYPWGETFWFYDTYMKNLKNFKVWFFSGTEDMAVDTLGSLRWIEKLNLNIKKEWRQWKCDEQIAGMVQDYDYGFTFVTVKGAGHMVPQDKRKEAKVMFDAFINGTFG